MRMGNNNEEPNYFKAKKAASALIEEFCITTPEEIDVEGIAMSRGLLVVEDTLEGADARLVRKGNKGILRVRQNIPEIGKKRFVIGHDLGHWELHQGKTQWDIISDSDIKAYTGSGMELEATTFASELLMPTKLLRPLCADVEPDLKRIQEISDTFLVTLTAASIRYIEESDYPCLVVFSHDGKILWWKKNNAIMRGSITKTEFIDTVMRAPQNKKSA